jgi:nucleoid-associated protein YgaU
MRKDVRIGLAIGGVLLAVLIVYLLVPKENTGNSNKTQAVAQGGGGSNGAASTGGLGGGEATPAASPSGTDAAQPPAPPAGNNHDTPSPTTRKDDPSFASGTESGAGAETSANQAETAGSNSAWSSILNDGVMPPSLVATNPPTPSDPFADPAKAANGSGAGPDARHAVGAPADKLDFGVGNGGAGAPAPAPATVGGNGNTGSAGSTSGTTVSTPPTSAQLSPAPGDLKEHKMAQGETFSSIALSLYGDSKYAREIVKANPNLEPSRVRAGTVIKLPDMATIRASQNAPAGATSGHAVTAGATQAKAEPAIDPSKEYKVQANDSLHKIALKLYGKADKADAIYDANKEKIGGDPHRIKVGMVLKLPEPPTHSPTATR